MTVSAHVIWAEHIIQLHCAVSCTRFGAHTAILIEFLPGGQYVIHDLWILGCSIKPLTTVLHAIGGHA